MLAHSKSIFFFFGTHQPTLFLVYKLTNNLTIYCLPSLLFITRLSFQGLFHLPCNLFLFFPLSLFFNRIFFCMHLLNYVRLILSLKKGKKTQQAQVNNIYLTLQIDVIMLVSFFVSYFGKYIPLLYTYKSYKVTHALQNSFKSKSILMFLVTIERI